MNNIDVNEIVKIETMPKVFSQLEKIGAFIDEQTKDIDTLECTEENKQEVKKRRTEINNTLKLLDDKRKEIKSTLLEPYEIFNSKYEDECKNKLLSASELLKTKIDTIEEEQKKEKENTLKEFFQEYQTSNHLEGIVEFENVGLNITISASEKSLKEQIKAFCEKVANDIKAIQTDENSEEVLFEYKNNGFDYAKAKTTLAERKKQLEEFKQHIAKNGEEIKQEEITIHNIETMVSAPKEVIEEEKNWYEFSALMTNTQAKELKEWFRDRNIEMR